jgi:hypothetical protein
MSLVGEMSGCARANHLHEVMKAANPNSQSQPPPMPDSALASFIVTCYMCSYNFKSDAISVNLNFLTMSKVLEDNTNVVELMFFNKFMIHFNLF